MDYTDLVKRLRKKAIDLPEKFSKNADTLDLVMRAADAIEELQKQLAESRHYYQIIAEAYEAEVTKEETE